MGNGATAIDFYLSLWVPEKSFFKRDKDKPLRIGDMNQFAFIELTGDAAMMMKSYTHAYRRDSADALDFHGNGGILNWYPGMLKVYLQHITAVLAAGKKSDYGDDVTIKNQVKALPQQTLYVDEGDFNRVSTFTGRDKTDLGGNR